jgi:hypothetical protein
MIHDIEVAGRPCRLVLHRPDSQSECRLAIHMASSGLDAQTGIESLTPEHIAPRISLSYSVVIDDIDRLNELKIALRTLGGRYLAVPIWPEMHGAPLFAAEQKISFDPDSGAYEMGWSSEELPVKTGLILGRLSEQSKLTAVTPECGEIFLEIDEVSPWESRVMPAVGAPSAFEFEPDWRDDAITWSLHTKRSYDHIGHGREDSVRAVNYRDKEVHEAAFLLDRDEVALLIAHYVSCAGSTNAFQVQPWWLPGSAPIKVRYASETLTFVWSGSPDYASSLIQLREELQLLDGAPSQGRPPRARLYRFQWDGGSSLLFTDWESPLCFNGETYEPRQIEHRQTAETLEPKGDEIEITSDNFPGNPLLPLVFLELERKLLLNIYECNPLVPQAAAEIFFGEVTKAKPAGGTLRAEAATYGGALSREIPRSRMQTTCNATLYSEICGVAKLSHKASGTLKAKAACVVEVDCAATAEANWYAYGWASFGTGAAVERRAILNSEPIAGGQRLTLHKPLKQAVGVLVEFYPGCDGQFSGGCAKFGNRDRFFGFPHMPAYLESVASGHNTQLGK